MRADKNKGNKQQYKPLVRNQDYDTDNYKFDDRENGQALDDEAYREYLAFRKQGQNEVNVQESIEEPKKKKKKKKKKNTALTVALIVVLILVIGVGAVIGAGLTVVHNKLNKVSQVAINRGDLAINTQVAKDLKNYRNIALLGIDARDMNSDEGVRSDAMIIASIDKRTNEVRLISIFRDTYVDLGENYGLDKMTHAYAYGKSTQTLQTINRNMDLNCEEVVVVNWKSVADTIDALGGIDIDIKDSEINEMNKYIKDTQKNIGGSKKLIKKAGKQTLNGNQAVTYARIRKDSVEGDYRRNERMKGVLSAAFTKAKTLSLSQLNAIADKILPEVKTNITTNEMMEMVLKIDAYTITDTKSWPFDTEGWMYNGIWYGPPITLKSNVSKLHAQYFEQPNYQPTQTVMDISERISGITGLY